MNHGSPTVETICVWPKCPNQRRHDAPLCGAHLTIAHGIKQRQIDNGKDTTEPWIVDYATLLPSPEPAEKPDPTTGTIYYLRVGGYIKIGWTSDLTKRMRQYPPDTVLLATEPGSRADETRLHKRFAHLRTHGREWFPLAPQITDHIRLVIDRHGPPPTVDHSARPTSKYTGRPRTYIGGPGRGKLPTRKVAG